MGGGGKTGRRIAGCSAMLLAGLALAGCEDPAPRRAEAPPTPDAATTPRGPQGRPGVALQLAEERLRHRLRVEGPLTLRAVQAYRQAMPDTLAICGQVNPAGRDGEPFLPWVAVVSFAGTTPTRTEFFLAASSPEATRVYFEMVDRCFDGGGPASVRQGIRPLPPAPSGLPSSATDQAPASPALAPAPAPPPAPAPSSPPLAFPLPGPRPAALAEMAPAMPPVPPLPRIAAPDGPVQAIGTVSTRQPANMRASPSGEAAVVRVVPRAAILELFREAPGGWLEVGGDGEAWGWLHSSLVDR